MARARSRGSTPGRIGVAGLLVFGGLISWLLYVVQSGGERTAFAPNGPPPLYVQVVAGHTYSLATPGGVSSETSQGLDPAKLTCTAAAPGEAPGALRVNPESSDTRAINTIGTFTAAMTGSLHVNCTGLPTIYVDDAASAATDWSGLWLVLASLLLAIGLPLALSALRSPLPAPGADDGDPDEAERDSTFS
jgi:hypothetical protein